MTRPLSETYPWWLAIVLASGVALAAIALLAAVTLLVRHVQRKALKAQLHADHEEWMRTHPAAPTPPPSLGGLTIRSRQVPAVDHPRSRGPATPSSLEAVPAADGGVAPQTATGRAVHVPRPARPVAPMHGGAT
jgi:hypothetical protein